MQKLNLPDVTVIAFENVDISKIEHPLKLINHYCDVGACKLLTSLDVSIPIDANVEVVKIRPTTYHDYNNFNIKDCGESLGFVGDYVETSHMLMVHHDGYILNPGAWASDFYLWDYIGAPSIGMSDEFGSPWGVGNGGFSLRSKRLLSFMKNSPVFNAYDSRSNIHDDGFICMTNRSYLHNNGFRIAPYDVAIKFSVENMKWQNQFGAHGIGNKTDCSSWIDPIGGGV